MNVRPERLTTSDDAGVTGDDEAGTRHWGQHVPALLDLDAIGGDMFRCRFNQPNFQKALYGGQLLAQAVTAAGRTGPVGDLHSLHAYFLQGGRGHLPVEFSVERLRDSHNSASRRVTARQDGQVIFELSCLFRRQSAGFFHQAQPPRDVAPPETLLSLVDIHRDDPSLLTDFGDFLLQNAPVDIRPLSRDHLRYSPGPARRSCWIRLPGAAGVSDPHVHRCLLAYLSDYWFARVTLVPHCAPVPERGLFFASIDHAMWFYGEPRVDEWLLYDAEGPAAGGDTGLAQGRLFDRAGNLVAVTTQEVVQRPRLVPLQL